jgi:hypothetical protein
MLRRASASIALAAFMIAAPALAQAPSQAQRAAIKSQCRNDYIAHCSSIPPGGAASLQCLQKNMASLAPGCASAVQAVGAPAAQSAPKAGSAPAAATTEAAPAATTAKPAAEAPAAAPAAAPPAAMALRPMRPREELFVLRSACGGDVRSICGGVQPGGGRIIRCLATNAGLLSPACRDVLSSFAAR